MGESLYGTNNSSKNFVPKIGHKETNKAATTNTDAADQAHQESPLSPRDIAAKLAKAQNQASTAQEISKDDIEKIKQDPSSSFALDLAANQNLTEAQIQQLIDDVLLEYNKYEFDEGLAQAIEGCFPRNEDLHLEAVIQQLKDLGKQPSTSKENRNMIPFVSVLAKNPNLTETHMQQVIDVVKQKPHLKSSDAEQITLNTKFIPAKEHIDVAIKNPNSFFARGLAANPNLTQTQIQQLIDVVKQEDPLPFFTSGLARNPNLTQTQIQQLIDVVESIFKQDTYCLLTTSLFPLDLSENPNLTETHMQQLIDLAIKNPNTLFAHDLAANPNLTQTHMQQLIDDILLEKVNEEHRYYKFEVALGLAKNPNLAQTQIQQLIDAQVPKLIDQMKNSLKLPDYQYVFDLAKNPNLTETQCKELINLVSFEKIGYSGSEATRFLNKAARFIADQDSKKVS